MNFCMPRDCMSTCVAAMEMLRKEDTNNVLYLLASALTQEGQESRLNTSSKAFKLINLILLSVVEADFSRVQRGSAAFLDALEVFVYNDKLCLSDLNEIIFPTGRYYYELDESADTQTVVLKKRPKLEKAKRESVESCGETPMDVSDEDAGCEEKTGDSIPAPMLKVKVGKVKKSGKRKMGGSSKKPSSAGSKSGSPEKKPDQEQRDTNFVFDPAIQCAKCKRVFLSEDAKTEHAEQGFCLSCSECKVMFHSPALYCQHLKDAHKTKAFLCSLCHKQFDNIKDCFIHTRQCDEEMRQYPCQVCKATFDSHQARSEHYLSCSWKECKQCPAKFEKIKSLQNHYKMEHDKYMCLHCVEPFDTRALQERHMRKNHYRRMSPAFFICDICGGRQASNYGLKKHKERMHTARGDRPVYPCEVCGVKLLSKRGVTTHMQTMHDGSTERQYPCKICGKMISRHNDSEHAAVHAGTVRFTCSVCGEGFVHRVPYKRHIFRHLGTRLFVCKVCGHTYDTPDLIRDHVRRFHKNFDLVFENLSIPSTNIRKDPVQFDFDIFARKNANMTLKMVPKSGGETLVTQITLPANIPVPVASTAPLRKAAREEAGEGGQHKQHATKAAPGGSRGDAGERRHGEIGERRLEEAERRHEEDVRRHHGELEYQEIGQVHPLHPVHPVHPTAVYGSHHSAAARGGGGGSHARYEQESYELVPVEVYVRGQHHQMMDRLAREEETTEELASSLTIAASMKGDF